MSTLSVTRTPNQLASGEFVNSHRGLTMDAVIPHLVGHTIEEVERGSFSIHSSAIPEVARGLAYSWNFDPVYAQQDLRIRKPGNWHSCTRRACPCWTLTGPRNQNT